MPLSTSLLTDGAELAASTGSSLAGLPPLIVITYLIVRLLTPVAVFMIAAHGATPQQRISLARTYLMRDAPTVPRTRRRNRTAQ